MRWLLDRFFGRKLERETRSYLEEIARSPILASHRAATAFLAGLRAELGPQVTFGETLWGASVLLPLKKIIRSHALVTGGTGAGKSVACLIFIKCLINLMPQTRNIGFGIVDAAKSDLFLGTIALLAKRLEDLAVHDEEAARELRRRIVIYDFSSRDPVSSYNILAMWPNADADFFASSRADLILDLLPGGDNLSLAAAALLRNVILLLSELRLPLVPYLFDVLHDAQVRGRLLQRCKNSSVVTYFARQFSEVPRPTLGALSRRMDALSSSAGVRLAFAGDSAPDFRLFQDRGKIVLINCSGANIAQSIRSLLQCLVVNDIHSSVFLRQRKDNDFLWFLDEAQSLLSLPRLRDHAEDLLRLSRSFGTHYVLVTQNLSASISDPRLLKIILTNIRWSFSMRGDPSNCAFLKPAFPVTGRKLQPQANPFDEKRFYSIPEERSMELDAVANLPDRVGWLWLKAQSAEALKIKTRELAIPQRQDLENVTLAIRHDPTVGKRFSRRNYERQIAQRDREWMAEPEGDLGGTLADAYRGARSKKP